jgi:hypothetical protein
MCFIVFIPRLITASLDWFFAVPVRGSWILKLSGTGPVCSPFKKGNGTETGPDFKALVHRAEYLANREQVHAFFLEMLDDAADNFDIGVDSSPSTDLPIDPGHLPPTLDDQLVQPIAAMSLNLDAANTNLRHDLYSKSLQVLKSSCFAFSGSTDFTTSAFISVLSLFNALLDSGCTHHIIQDRSLFSNYTSKSIPIKTANCGTLAALGTGDVDFRSSFRDQSVIFTLRGCLYAPSASINLLSVGALVEREMSALFSPGGMTKVSFPADHPTLPAFTFTATVVNRLSFLKLDFVPPGKPMVDVSATALPALSFPRVKLDSMLWHLLLVFGTRMMHSLIIRLRNLLLSVLLGLLSLQFVVEVN